VHSARWVPADTLVPEVVRQLETSPELDSIVVLEPDGRIAVVRRAHLFGQLHGRYGYALYERAAIRQLVEHDPLIVEANERPVDVIAMAVGRDAAHIYDDIVVAENGRFVGSVSMRLLMAHGKDLLVSSLADRTVLEERNRKLDELARKLDELNRLQHDFVANMTHELRSPINTMIGIARLFTEDHALSAERREDAELLLSRGHDLLAIVNNLLDLHKLDAAQMTPVLEQVDLPALLAEALEAARFLVDGKPVRLELDARDAPPVFVTDGVLLRRILTNLMSNAVKFTKRGTVRLSAHREDRGLCIQVADTGIGVRKEDLGRLFKKFEQLETGKLNRHGGTGLGLTIVRELIELLGGSISVESSLGVGTTFTARFDGLRAPAPVPPPGSSS